MGKRGGTEMKKLEFPIERSGFRYTLIQRHNSWAIVEQKNLRYPEAPVRFEVWKIKVVKESVFKGKVLPKREKMPGNEQWGTHGWTFLNLHDAFEWFREKAGISKPPEASD